MFENIRKGPLKVPSDIHKQALDLIVKLLNRDPTLRLGAGPTDAEEIKRHPFFHGVDWADVRDRKLTPPKPLLMPVFRASISFDCFCEPDAEHDERLPKWSFISPEFK